jgi:hypothetical protein
MLRSGAELELQVDAPEHEHLALELDLARCPANQSSAVRWDVTRLQRASEGTGQSTRGRGHDVVYGRSMRFVGTRLAPLGGPGS